jgi:hypothetical protein
MHLGEVRLETQSLFEVRDGVGHPAGHLRQGDGEVAVRLGIIGLETQASS